jgi:hypothetical protein
MRVRVVVAPPNSVYVICQNCEDTEHPKGVDANHAAAAGRGARYAAAYPERLSADEARRIARAIRPLLGEYAD